MLITLMSIFVLINTKFLLVGAITNDNFTASSCSWNVKTSALTTYQSNALSNGVYRNNCDCKVSIYVRFVKVKMWPMVQMSGEGNYE